MRVALILALAVACVAVAVDVPYQNCGGYVYNFRNLMSFIPFSLATLCHLMCKLES